MCALARGSLAPNGTHDRDFLLAGAAAAQSTVHKPISTGDCSPAVGGDENDASAVVWVPLAQKWIMTDQRYFFVYSKDGVLEHQSSGYVTCKGAAEHEGFTLVDLAALQQRSDAPVLHVGRLRLAGNVHRRGANGDVLWAQDEDLGFRCTNNPNTTCADDAPCGGTPGQSNLCKGTGAMCRYSIDAILKMGQAGNPATPVSLEEVWVPSVPANSNEGLVFVPGVTPERDTAVNSSGPSRPTPDGGRSRLTRRFRRSRGARIRVFPAGCSIGGDLSDGYYDFVKAALTSQSDGGNRYTVHSGDFTTCHASVPDPATCRADNGYEGLALRRRESSRTPTTGPATTDDAYNGLWLLEDDSLRVTTVKVSTGDLRRQRPRGKDARHGFRVRLRQRPLRLRLDGSALVPDRLRRNSTTPRAATVGDRPESATRRSSRRDRDSSRERRSRPLLDRELLPQLRAALNDLERDAPSMPSR